MNKICTSFEQSEKLIELGIDVNTADMFYTTFYGAVSKSLPLPKEVYDILKYPIDEDKCASAWSLTALLGLMPFHIIENNNRFGFYQVKGFNKQGETYRFGYKTNNDSFLFETSWYNDVIDAAFEMVCWLKENEKI